MTQAVLGRVPTGTPRTNFRAPVVLIAVAGIVALGLLVQESASTRLALLFVTGTVLGIVLYQSLFGFTSAFRVLLADGRSAGFRRR